jgi:glycosyltransferase involved in cell wall biosynthesis
MKLSLVICTRNRASQLAETLKTLDRITTQFSWELILVDNGSTDRTQEVITNYDSPVAKRVVVEPKPGLGRARNAGWRASRGELVVFTDDDCYPAPDFLYYMARAFDENPTLGFVGGRVLLFDPTDYPITIQTREDRCDFRPGEFIPPGRIQGASMAFRRTALVHVSGFDGRFGAGESFACEDVDIQARLVDEGWHGAYDPRPVVYHHHKRKTKKAVAELMRAYDRGRGAYYAKFILNSRTRRVYLKNWYWTMKYHPLSVTLREFEAALEFLLLSWRRTR